MSSAYHFGEFVVSAEMVEALENYVHQRFAPGGFLEAVICNNFKEACGRADGFNIRNLPAFAAYLYNEMPSPSQGSPEAYEAWLKGPT